MGLIRRIPVLVLEMEPCILIDSFLRYLAEIKSVLLNFVEGSVYLMQTTSKVEKEVVGERRSTADKLHVGRFGL